MKYQKQVVFKGEYIEAHSIGEKSYQTAVDLWSEITKSCAEHNCFKVLGIGESTKPMPVMDAFDHQKLFRDFEVTRKYKIAWVEINKNAVASVKFLETVLLNRGMLNGKLFDTVVEAKQWLLK